MPDLHSRIAVEIARRLAVARTATPGPWTSEPAFRRVLGCRCLSCYEDTPAGSMIPELDGPPGFDVSPTLAPEDAAFVALHDPADAERRYSAALRVLNRHASCESDVHGHHIERAQWCDLCWTAHPCPEVLDVAAGLDITEGSTTDG